jgi:RimJ/RimL family protein N-acetyltransferase
MTPFDAPPAAVVAETARLRLRRFEPSDAAFAMALVNDPAWVRFIGKRDVPDLDAARRYLENGPIAMYAKHGFGLWCVALRSTGEAIGMCGLIKRDTLPDVDVGFAFLPRYRGLGYALEAAQATMAYARDTLGLARVVAILSKDNERSASLLVKLGFVPEGTITMPNDAEELALYAWEEKASD